MKRQTFALGVLSAFVLCGTVEGRDFTNVRVLGTEVSDGARTAAALLKERIADRTALSSAGDVFRVTYVLDPSVSGDVARVSVKGGEAVVRAGRTRGFLAGSGNLLKSLRYGVTSFAAADGTYDFAPAKELRMAYLSRHFLNSFMEAPAETMCRYMDDLALDGINAFKFQYCISPIDVSYESAERIAAFERTSKAMHDRLVVLDCGFCAWGGGNQLPQNSPESLRGEPNVVPRRGNAGFNACPEKPGALEAIYAWQETELDKLNGARIDFFCHWPYDEGGCNCEKCRPWGGNGMPRLVEKLAARNKVRCPGAKTIFSTWYFLEEDFVGLWKYLETHDWVDYLLIADPGIDPDFPVRNPPPGHAKLITFPEISMWGRAPWGGFGATVIARRLEKAFRQVEKVVSGFNYYSEGFFEDVNKAVVTDLYVNPDETVDGILRRYAAYHFAGTDPEDFVRLAALLEKTHRIEDWQEADVTAAKALVDKMDREILPSLKSSWRWRLVYLRATIDRGIFGTRYRAYQVRDQGDVLSPEMHACFDELTAIYCTKIQTLRFLEGYRYGATAPLYVPAGAKPKVHVPPEGVANEYLKRYFDDQMIQEVRLGPGTWRLEPMDVRHVNCLDVVLLKGCRLVRPDGTPYEKPEDAFHLDPKNKNIRLKSSAAPGGNVPGSVELAKDGKTDYVIVVGKDAPKPDRFAAEELKLHLEKATGATLAIVEGEVKKEEGGRWNKGWIKIPLFNLQPPTSNLKRSLF